MINQRVNDPGRLWAFLIIAIGVVAALLAFSWPLLGLGTAVFIFTPAQLYLWGAIYVAVGLFLFWWPSAWRANEPDQIAEIVPMPAAQMMDALAQNPANLTLIEGIGPRTTEVLHKAGVTTFAQIAAMTPEALHHIVQVEAGIPLLDRATNSWPKQAQLLVDGDVDGFYAYTEFLKGGIEPEFE
jgi:predicted flap endonuclease-1-like 5' DNA nuclease